MVFMMSMGMIEDDLLSLTQLAGLASEMVVMTDDEKKRVQDLLSDVDALPDITEEGGDSDISVIVSTWICSSLSPFLLWPQGVNFYKHPKFWRKKISMIYLPKCRGGF